MTTLANQGFRITLLSLVLCVFSPLSHAELEVVSKPYANSPNTFGDSSAIELSGDGKWAVFSSNGNGLATNDNNGFTLDLFLRNLETGEIKLISRNTSGTSADGDSLEPSISEDGHFVVFESDADDLVPGDDNETTDIFLYDQTTGALQIISKTAAGELGDGDSADAVMTSDARFILFDSDSDNLSADASDGADNLYLYDRQSGDLELVTYNFDGSASASIPGNLAEFPFEASLSKDGHFITFVSAATNLVSPAVFSGLTIVAPQVYLRDMQNRTNILLTETSSGKASTSIASSPVISENGAYVSFLSGASNLTGTATGPMRTSLYLYNTASGELSAFPPPKAATTASEFVAPTWSADGHFLAYGFDGAIYLWDTVLGQNKLISTTTNGLSDSPSISADGRFIAFTSSGTDLQENPVSGQYFQLYAYDQQSGTTTLLTRNQSGTDGANRDIIFPTLSANGQVAGFTTYATDLLAADSKLQNDVFVVSTTNSTSVKLASVPSPLVISATANASSGVQEQALSADGRMIVFSSAATDLVANDENSFTDIFVRDLGLGITHLVSLSQDGVHSANASSGEAAISANGRFVAFTSSASNIVSLSAPVSSALYVYDVLAGTNQLASIGTNGDVLIKASKAMLSADGTRIAFFGTLSNSTGVKNEIYLRDLTQETTLWSTNALNIRDLIISPNGQFVAFGNSLSGLTVYDSGNGTQTRVAAGTGRTPIAFSGDGSILLGTTTGTGSSTRLALFESSSTNFTAVSTATLGITYSSTAWSADGSTIMYILTSGTNRTLTKYDVASGTTTPLQLPGGIDVGRPRGNLVLSANGKIVTFATIQSGSFFPVVLRFDTESGTVVNVSQKLNGGTAQFGAQSVSMSSDGNIVAFESGSADLVADDRNLLGDVFVFRASGGSDPNPLAFTASVKVDSNLTLNWKSESGKFYQLQFRPSLNSGAWADLGPAMDGNRSTSSVQVQMNATGSGFYRIKLLL